MKYERTLHTRFAQPELMIFIEKPQTDVIPAQAHCCPGKISYPLREALRNLTLERNASGSTQNLKRSSFRRKPESILIFIPSTMDSGFRRNDAKLLSCRSRERRLSADASSKKAFMARAAITHEGHSRFPRTAVGFRRDDET